MASRNQFPKGSTVEMYQISSEQMSVGMIGKVVSARGNYIKVEFDDEDIHPFVRTIHFVKAAAGYHLRRLDSVTPGRSLPKVRKEEAVQDVDGGDNSGSQDDVKPRIRASKKRGATKVVQV